MQRSLVALLVWAETSRFSEFGFEGVDIGTVIVRPTADMEAVGRAWARIEELCRPCDRKVAARKLTELRGLTITRGRDDTDNALVGAAYVERLCKYPEDVVSAACDRWANREEFWPSWAELKAECDKLMRGREKIREAFASWRPA